MMSSDSNIKSPTSQSIAVEVNGQLDSIQPR